MPLASVALNVTEAVPKTRPPPQSIPPTFEEAGAPASESVTFAEYMSACTSCNVEPAKQSLSGGTGWHLLADTHDGDGGAIERGDDGAPDVETFNG